jgi:hypothetical protein
MRGAKLLFWALTLPTFVFAAQAGNTYARSVHMVYANNGTKHLDDSDINIQKALGRVTGNVTTLSPFFLNMPPESLSQYQDMLNWVAERNITITPAVGGSPNNTKLNSNTNQAIAQAYKNISSHIRLENLTGFFQNDADDVRDFINFCIRVGFTNIMLNPWPYASPGVLADFTAKKMRYIDAAFQQVDPDTWTINTQNVDNIIQKLPSIQILVNYESPGPQKELSNEEESNPGSSVDAFKMTLKQITNVSAADHLNWCPPFTQSYDPLQFSPPTWSWIAGQLGQL